MINNSLIKRLFSLTVSGAVVVSSAGIGSTAFASSPNNDIIYPVGRYDIMLGETGESSFTDEPFYIFENSDIRLDSFVGNNSYSYINQMSSDQKYIYKQLINTLFSDPGAESCNVVVPEKYHGNVLDNFDNIRDEIHEDIAAAFIALVLDTQNMSDYNLLAFHTRQPHPTSSR